MIPRQLRVHLIHRLVGKVEGLALKAAESDRDPTIFVLWASWQANDVAAITADLDVLHEAT